MPFKAVLSGDKIALAKLSMKDLLTLFNGDLHRYDTRRVPGRSCKRLDGERPSIRAFDRPYTEMVYQPMLEVMKYLRDNGYRTYIVTGGGQDFVRAYAQQVYGIPPDQIDRHRPLKPSSRCSKDGHGPS